MTLASRQAPRRLHSLRYCPPPSPLLAAPSTLHRTTLVRPPWQHRPLGRGLSTTRLLQKDEPPSSVENATDISHSHFLSSASPSSDFNPTQTPSAGTDTSALSQWQGKLSPTSSHLFKLLLPLPKKAHFKGGDRPPQPTAFLLHPSQPLSHLARLIVGSLPPQYRDCEISFLALTGQEKDVDSHLRNAEEEEGDAGRQEGGPFLRERTGDGRWQEVSWSQSTDLSDFIKQACLNEKFKITIEPSSEGGEGVTLEVSIPSFASRTTYLRHRLLKLTRELDEMTKKKKAIDLAAHKGAQRLAVVALGGGVAYWVAIIRWTFFTDAGWDLMEPVTWATGFGALLCSAAFLVYHNREVSYSSLLDLSISARQRRLYDKHGLDIERWTEMVAEAKTLRKEIARIAADYDLEWKGELENLERDSEPLSSRINGPPKEKIDIDKTIDEASELASQTSEEKAKEKARQRRGEVSDSDADEDSESAKKGEERAEEVANKK